MAPQALYHPNCLSRVRLGVFADGVQYVARPLTSAVEASRAKMRSGVFTSRIRGLYAGGIITVDAPCKLSLLAEQRRCFQDIVDAAAAIQISPVSIIRGHLS